MLFKNFPMDNQPDEDRCTQNRPSVAFHTLARSWVPDLQEPSSDLQQEMAYLLYQSKEQLSVIANVHSPSRNASHRLMEAELVTSTIEAVWDNHRGRQEEAAMNLQASQIEVCMFIRHSRSMSQTQELVWAVRRELLKMLSTWMTRTKVTMTKEITKGYTESQKSRAIWLVAEAELQEKSRWVWPAELWTDRVGIFVEDHKRPQLLLAPRLASSSSSWDAVNKFICFPSC
jgi:hypothetical protein